MRDLLLALTMVTTLPACSPVAVLNTLAPRAGISVTLNVPYGGGDRRSLDIYAPVAWTPEATGPAGAPVRDVASPGVAPLARVGANVDTWPRGAPVVVFIYGGGWKDGDKANYRFVAAPLAARGFLTVVPDYRVFPQVRFPVFIQDAAAAVAWVRNNIAGYGGDPRRIFLMGHSAGAHIVAMLALDRQWLAADGLDADRDIAGMVGLAGPYDFLPLHDPELDDIFGPAGELRLTQPISFAHGGAAPMFLAAGTGDTTVLPRNTEHLAAAVRRDGGQVEETLYPGIGHRLILGAIAGPLRWIAPVLLDVTRFLDGHAGWRAADAAAPTADGCLGSAAAGTSMSIRVEAAAGMTLSVLPDRERVPLCRLQPRQSWIPGLRRG